MAPNPNPNQLVNSALVSVGYDGNDLLRQLRSAIAVLRFDAIDKRRLNRSCEELVGVLDRCPGKTLQARSGQIAAREIEIVRIGTALRRADEFHGDVADAIEAAASGLRLASPPSGQPPQWPESLETADSGLASE
jgi:hypothetical protein